MSETEPTPEVTMPSREQALAAFKQFVDQGITNPDDLPLDDPAAIAANKLFYSWGDHAKAVAEKDPRPEALFEYNLAASTFYVDAGFSDPDYLDEVANDWLVQDLDRINALGLTELAAKIEAKIDELNTRLAQTPEETGEDMSRPTIEQIVEATSDVLNEEAIVGLRELELDDEDFLMAVFGELSDAGIDAEAYLREKGLLE